MTIEGIEGAGKSTLAAGLCDKLRGAGRQVVLTSEPGGDPLADRIREMLLDSADGVCDRTELLLFEAARAQHVQKKIRPALESGAVVVCDRFADSSTAYQGYARGMGPDVVRSLNSYATGGLQPDLTLLLDLPVQAGLARQGRRDRISQEPEVFHEAVRQGYLATARAEHERVVVIDAARDRECVLEEAWMIVSRRLREVWAS